MFSSVSRQDFSSNGFGGLELAGSSRTRHKHFIKKIMLSISSRARWFLPLSVTLIMLWLVAQYFFWQSSPPYFGPYEALLDDGAEGHGFLPLKQATEFCQTRRWKPYATRNRRRKVYDLVLINTELDELEIRLNELDNEVDYFVVVEAPYTFQMNEKPLHLKENLHLPQFKAFEHKLIHRVLDMSDTKISKDSTWGLERWTRDAIFNQVMLSLTDPQAPSHGDVLLAGDIDEIPRITTVTALRNCAFPPRVTLRTQMYYYSFQWLHRGPLWHHSQATYYNGPEKTIRPDSLRTQKADIELYMAGWHCSSCFGTLADLKTKISSFSHRSYNQPYYLDTERLLDRVRTGTDLFDRHKEIYDRIDNNKDIPAYLQLNESRARFDYMLDRDPWHANFRDLR